MMWFKMDKKARVVDVLKISKAEKNISLAEALEAYSKVGGQDLEYPTQIRLWSQKALELLDGKRPINTLTVKDMDIVFNAVLKKENEATAYRVRSTISNAVNYVCTGTLPPARNPIPRKANLGAELTTAAPSNGDIGEMKFSIGNFKDMAPLIPRYSIAGRFPAIKAEIQKAIFSVSEGQSVLIEPRKRSMDLKEGRAIEKEIGKMFTKNGLPWGIRYNPNDKVFVVATQSDLDSLKINKPKKESK